LAGNYLGKPLKTNEQIPDINHDGKIDIQDIIMIGKRFGTVYSPSAPSSDIWIIDEKYLPILIKISSYMNYSSRFDPDFINIKDLIKKLISSVKISKTMTFPNYPNPSNPETWIPYQLSEDSDVVIRIYSLNGNLVKTIDLGHKKSGVYLTRDTSAHWDGKNESGDSVSSGIYFYSFKAGNYYVVRKIMVVR
jgi:hypothetical protein